MIRALRLTASTLITVERIDHPCDAPHVDPLEEASRQYSINLLERGEFSVQHGPTMWRVTPADMFLTVPERVHRYVHREREAPSDVCVAVSFTDAARDEISGFIPSLSRATPVVALNNRRAYLRHRLFDHLSTGADSMAMDILAAEPLDGSLDDRNRRPE